MSDDKWIVIRNWDKFQHYSDRKPIWIKNYLDLLHDHNYVQLSETQRAVLHGLWLLYASTNAQQPLNSTLISRAFGLKKVSRRTLDALNHAGFIEYSASPVLAHCYQVASLEKNTTYSSKRGRGRGSAAPAPQREKQSEPDYPLIPVGERL